MATQSKKFLKGITPKITKLIEQAKVAQGQVQKVLENKSWLEEARKMALKQSGEMKRLLGSDVTKVKTFIENERKELERFQKQIPGEVDRVKKFLDNQKKEFEILLKEIKKSAKEGGREATAKPKATPKKASGARKKASKASRK